MKLRGTAELADDFGCCEDRRPREIFINICVLRLNYVSARGDGLKVIASCMPAT